MNHFSFLRKWIKDLSGYQIGLHASNASFYIILSVFPTIMLIAAAAALGDAGSPASDTTLGPTSGLNADGQHDHIWDTCVPTAICYNVPLALCAIFVAPLL